MDSFIPFLGQCLHALDGGGTFPAVAWTLFLAGLMSGFTHCSFMCAPFVLMQTSRHLERVPAAGMSELTRLRGALLIPYHLGRMTTYAILGGAAAGLIGGFALWWRDATALALGLSGLAILLAALPVRLPVPHAMVGASQRVLHFVAPLAKAPFGLRGYFLGMALGLLPCGMIYGALMAASATANMPAGAISMAAFAAGTAPGLIVTAVAGNLALNRFRTRAKTIAVCGSVLAGLWLCVVSVRLLLT